MRQRNEVQVGPLLVVMPSQLRRAFMGPAETQRRLSRRPELSPPSPFSPLHPEPTGPPARTGQATLTRIRVQRVLLLFAFVSWQDSAPSAFPLSSHSAVDVHALHLLSARYPVIPTNSRPRVLILGPIALEHLRAPTQLHADGGHGAVIYTHNAGNHHLNASSALSRAPTSTSWQALSATSATLSLRSS